MANTLPQVTKKDWSFIHWLAIFLCVVFLSTQNRLVSAPITIDEEVTGRQMEHPDGRFGGGWHVKDGMERP